MISSQLSTILRSHVMGGGEPPLPGGDGDVARLPLRNGLEITVASIPDPGTVMFFGQIGHLPEWAMQSTGGWICVENGEPADIDSLSEGVPGSAALVYDQATGMLALTESAPALALDAAAFGAWIQRFADELEETKLAFDDAVHKFRKDEDTRDRCSHTVDAPPAAISHLKA